jgi:hypothetical protein
MGVDWCQRKSYLVVGLDVKFDLFTSESADSARMLVYGFVFRFGCSCASGSNHLACVMGGERGILD